MTATAVKNETGRIAPRDLRTALSLAAALRARTVELRPDCALRFGDTDASATVPFPGRPWEGESARLDRTLFARVVRACTSDLLVTVEGSSVKLESDSLTVELAKLREPSLPAPGDDPVELLSLDALDLARLLVAALPFSSTDWTRPTLCQVALDLKRGKVAATDSYRLAVLDAPMVRVEDSDETLLIPRTVAGPLSTALKLAGGEVTIARHSEILAFSFGGQQWTMRDERFQYPNWEQLLPDGGFETALSVGAAELRATASLIADLRMSNAPLRLAVTRDGVTVASDCPDRAAVRQRIDATIEQVDRGGLEIGFNPEFTRDIASAIAPERVGISLISPLRPALFTAPGAQYLLMPIRLNA